MPDTRFCVCCGEEVPYNRIARDGTTELTCQYCGFVLDINIKVKTDAADCILIADDAPLIRDLLRELIIKKGLAKEAVASEDGQDFMVAFNKRLADKLPVNLAILDIEMPVLDGIKAAMGMRAIEKQHQSDRIPILFFSARKCDETLKNQLALFSPARYVNKGNADDPESLATRVDQLVSYLLSKHNRA